MKSFFAPSKLYLASTQCELSLENITRRQEEAIGNIEMQAKK